jgi:hypothetical protein
MLGFPSSALMGITGITRGRGVRDELPTVKVCVLARMVVVPSGVTVLLGPCNPPRLDVNSRPILGRSDKCTPLCAFVVVVHSAWGCKAE